MHLSGVAFACFAFDLEILGERRLNEADNGGFLMKECNFPKIIEETD